MRIFFILLALIPFASASAQEAVLEQLVPGEELKVQLVWPEIYPDEIYDLEIKFLDPKTNEPLQDTVVNYTVSIVQHIQIELYENQTTVTGSEKFEVLFPEYNEAQVQVRLYITSIEYDSKIIPIDEQVRFDVYIVPEFATLALIVMAISFIGIFAIVRFRNQSHLFRVPKF